MRCGEAVLKMTGRGGQTGHMRTQGEQPVPGHQKVKQHSLGVHTVQVGQAHILVSWGDISLDDGRGMTIAFSCEGSVPCQNVSKWFPSASREGHLDPLGS